MAITEEGQRLSEDHRKKQLSQKASTIKGLTKQWKKWDPHSKKSFESFLDGVVDIVRAEHEDSADMAAEYYEEFRKAEKIHGDPNTRKADRIKKGEIKKNMWATGFQFTLGPLKDGFSVEEAKKKGLVRASGSAARMVTNGGRDTVIQSTSGDKRSKGWARVTDSNPCPFCVMLASRGPVYKEDSADFQAHDHCGCSAEPHYEGSEWPGKGKEFKELWDELSEGKSGKDAIKTFRRNYENR